MRLVFAMKLVKVRSPQHIRRASGPGHGAVGLHHQAQQIGTHGLCHLGVDGGVLQEGVGQSLGLQVFNGLLQGDHVRLVDGVDAQQQGRAVGHGGVLPLLGQHGRPVGIDVRLVKAPLDAEGLAQIELVGPAP